MGSLSLVDTKFLKFNSVLHVEPLLRDPGSHSKTCTLIRESAATSSTGIIDLSSLVEDVLQLRKEVPLELVVNMFRKLVRISSFLLCFRFYQFHRSNVVYGMEITESTPCDVHTGGNIDGYDLQDRCRSIVERAP